jgi:hypothetical protein
MEPKCQACGFRVFNRRYPKCESCGEVLASGIALSLQERDALLEQDRAISETEWQEKQRKLKSYQPDTDVGPALLGASVAASLSGEP